MKIKKNKKNKFFFPKFSFYFFPFFSFSKKTFSRIVWSTNFFPKKFWITFFLFTFFRECMFHIVKRGGIPLKNFFSRLRRVVYLGVLFFPNFQRLFFANVFTVWKPEYYTSDMPPCEFTCCHIFFQIVAHPSISHGGLRFPHNQTHPHMVQSCSPERLHRVKLLWKCCAAPKTL